MRGSRNRRLAGEKQTYGGNDRYATYNAFASLPPSRFTFPNAREVGYNYDSLYRRTKIEDDPDGTPADVAQWWFYGPARVAELKLGSGLYCTQMNNARTNSAVQSPTPQNPAWGNHSSDRLGYDPASRHDPLRRAGGADPTIADCFLGTAPPLRESAKSVDSSLPGRLRGA